MRRFTPLLAISFALAACGGAAVDSAAAPATSAPEPPATTVSTSQPVETTGAETAPVETTIAATTTTAAPVPTTTPATTDAHAVTTTTSGSAPAEDARFETLAHTPPAVFDSYVSTMSVTMGFDDAVFGITGDGAWVNGSFECSMGMDIGGFAFSQSVVATPDAVWFDDGTGFRESVLNTAATDVLASCPASPLFWEDFVNAGLKPVGDVEEFAGRNAIKVDLTTILDFGGSLGVVPEVQDAVINAMDMWVDVETNAVLGLYADIAMDPSALDDLGVPGAGTGEAIVMTMDLRIDRINDPTIKIVAPTG